MKETPREAKCGHLSLMRVQPSSPASGPRNMSLTWIARDQHLRLGGLVAVLPRIAEAHPSSIRSLRAHLRHIMSMRVLLQENPAPQLPINSLLSETGAKGSSTFLTVVFGANTTRVENSGDRMVPFSEPIKDYRSKKIPLKIAMMKLQLLGT
ncbi:Derlin-2 [Fusarium oxysporum f. sp. albedinis]|nr:Derlin-2 [Fusarium oxysporum f. sp. albedinis]